MITKEVSNCRQLNNFSLFKSMYMYIDSTHNFEADAIFVNKGIKGIKFLDTYQKPNCKYCIVVCKVPKKYKDLFIECMSELESKLLILGYHDYIEFCEKIFKDIENGELV